MLDRTASDPFNNAVLYYAPSIFAALGTSSNTTSLLATGVVGIAMFLATIPAVLYIDKLGRKPVLLTGAIAMGICHAIIAILFGINQHQWATHKAAGWAAVTMVWLFVVNFGYSWGPCGWVIISEVWPLSNRAYGIALGASSNWMSNFIVGQITPIMLQKITYGTFIFFGLLTFGGGAFVWLFVPETKRLTLEEMDVLFGSKGVAEAVSLAVSADASLLSFLFLLRSPHCSTPVHSLTRPSAHRTPAAWRKSIERLDLRTSCEVWEWALIEPTRAAKCQTPMRTRRKAASTTRIPPRKLKTWGSHELLLARAGREDLGISPQRVPMRHLPAPSCFTLYARRRLYDTLL